MTFEADGAGTGANGIHRTILPSERIGNAARSLVRATGTGAL